MSSSIITNISIVQILFTISAAREGIFANGLMSDFELCFRVFITLLCLAELRC